MKQTPPSVAEFDDENDELDVAEELSPGSIPAVVSGTDWTTETVVSQLKRKNIILNPAFQRRDAWKIDRKSRFIESLIVGLPIPQIVLAESKKERGKFIILDGKQRLLSILQFWGLGDGENNNYKLSGLTLRSDLEGKNFEYLENSKNKADDYNALCNQTITTVVIRNWKDTDFLHTVFLRLNTGNVTLSPQELRQALLPGPFTEYIDEAAGISKNLGNILGSEGPDPRMRDIEILSRFLAFRFFSEEYPGRMKSFLDNTFEKFNKNWESMKELVVEAVRDFEVGVDELFLIFGEAIARKPTSAQFNRAIFDALIYFQSQQRILVPGKKKRTRIKNAYESLFTPGSEFLKAVESDTAGAPNTYARLSIWANSLSNTLGISIDSPRIPTASENRPKRMRPKK